jgi:pentatricopeptide repeat protein
LHTLAQYVSYTSTTILIDDIFTSLITHHVIAACARSGEWSHALKLFVDMKADRIQCDIAAYNALLSAFANGGEYDMVRILQLS